VHGAACDPDAEPYCYYACADASNAAVFPSATCQDGKWCGRADPTCVSLNPAPCPATAPNAGDACDNQLAEAYQCTYACAGGGARVMSCVTRWVVATDTCASGDAGGDAD
jgi:hypothetical protein